MNNIDPFDLFDIILNGGNINNANRRRAYRNQEEDQRENQRNHNHRQQQPVGLIAKLTQLFPIIIVLVFWIFPMLFQSVFLLIKL